ncbi:MAG: DUF4988 domain-containing protein, partial [Clostridia bacterium]|nr:DUF4988 domain-containing protein [Clostridia bacterium]
KTDVKAKGEKGEDGTNYVWTIDADGYWCLNGTKYTDDNYPYGIKAVGKDGSTPTIEISDDGYWVINGTKTDVKAKGEDGHTPTIEIDPETGEWLIDGEGSGYYANGEKGDKGDPGEDGAIYVLKPNYTTGYWELYKLTPKTDDGEASEASTASDDTEYDWNLENGEYMRLSQSDYGITAIWDGNTLHLMNVLTANYDEDGNVVSYTFSDYDIFLGQELNSVAFVPSFLDKDTFYPTTAPFIGITSYLDDEKTNEDGTFEAQTATVVSESTTLVYRLNPSNAYIENSQYDFITRNVKVRSANEYGDDESLFTIIGEPAHIIGDEYLSFKVALTGNISEAGYDLTALRVTTGTNPEGVVTSDYIRVKGAENVEPILVCANDVTGTGSSDTTVADDTNVDNGTTTSEEAVAGFYPRTKGLGKATGTDKWGYSTYTTETSDFVHRFIDGAENTDPSSDSYVETTDTDFSEYKKDNCEFAYNSSDYITGHVDLYVNVDGEASKLSDLIGESAISYEYVLPDHFYIDGVDQQEYVQILVYDETTAGTDHLVGAYIDVDGDSPITYDRYPVVRVNAYVNGYLVASTYIVYHITGVKHDPVTIDLNDVLNGGDAYYVHYRAIQTDHNASGATGLDEICGMTLSEFYEQLTGIDEKVVATDLLEYYLTNYYVENGSTVNAYICANKGDGTWTYNHYDYGAPGSKWSSGEYPETDDDVEDPNATTTSLVGDLMKNALKDWWAEIVVKYPYLEDYEYLLKDEVYQQHDGFVVGLNIPALLEGANVVSLGVDDSILTQHTYPSVSGITFPAATYKDADGEVIAEYPETTYTSVAEYVCQFTITSKDPYAAPDITVKVHVYVVDDCDSLTLSDLYKVPDPSQYEGCDLSADDEAVLVKGKLESDGFMNETDVSEHFANTGNVFEYTDEAHNVNSVNFTWETGQTGVYPDAGVAITSANESMVYLTEAIEGKYVAKLMDYNEILDNGEPCPWKYWIIFENPFVRASDGADTLDDTADENLADANKGVTVEDVDGETILTYEATTDDEGNVTGYSWKLSEYANTYYGVTDMDTDVTISYLAGGDWDYLQNNLVGTAYLTLYVDEIPTDGDGEDLPGYATATSDYPAGTIVWNNGGTKLQYEYEIDIEITITFKKIGSVSATSTITLNQGGFTPHPTTASLSSANVVL